MAYFREMGLDEYREKAFNGIRKQLYAFPSEEVENYIKTLDDDVKLSYEEDKRLSLRRHPDRICYDPDGYAYGKMMEF